MANKKAVLSRPLPDAQVARNAFDRSSMREYHTALGQLTPVWWEPVIAGSHCKLNRKIFQRTADVNTAAFPILDTHIQYYFVPMRLMWSYWENFKLGINDYNSGALSYSSGGQETYPSQVPYTTFGDLMSALAYIQSNSLKDQVGLPALPFAEKVLNYLGYGQGDFFPPSSDPLGSFRVNLWPLLAYHKIYYDHFRNTAYETNRPQTYNLDHFWAKSGSASIGWSALVSMDANANIAGLLAPHYVNYRDDYFTNVYPALNYVQSTPTGVAWQIPANVVGGTVGSIQVQLSGSTGFDTNRWTNQNGTAPSSGAVDSDVSGNLIRPGIEYLRHDHSLSQQVSLNANQILSPQAIRSAFALDKLMRSSAYAPKHVKQQYEARFGIKYPENQYESDYIGSFMNGIQIGEVTSTATTDATDSSGNTVTTPVGAIGGKGVGFDDFGKTLEYNAKEDGIIMAVQYTTIRSSYRALGLDSYLTKFLPEDYFQPEFQDLGLEPIYGYEYNRSLGSTIVMGYRPRNQRYKLGIDKNYGLFMDMQQDMSMFINHTDIGRIPSSSGLSFGWFKVQPTDLNGIMRVDFDGSWSTDQFITQCEFGFTCVQNMSVHGQPKL